MPEKNHYEHDSRQEMCSFEELVAQFSGDEIRYLIVVINISELLTEMDPMMQT